LIDNIIDSIIDGEPSVEAKLWRGQGVGPGHVAHLVPFGTATVSYRTSY